ncbi:large conductance mechanosensitive channel protein MscL [Subtercola lobariae]|uniref:Large-conductance mechanosensitive channel n=1 Tax=Subtercola lobariae TaxID=1588641 RepID=A0A917B1U9_9MICO|nr:large conductance mechanosensitive channel protein MscL [Subtercola lobariae]
MIKGFREFILRGNVIDLAVAVVIGAAFTAVVTAIVTGIFNPLIAALFNAEQLNDAFEVQIGDSTLKFGLVLGAIIQFLLVAVVVYFVFVLPINHLKKVSFFKSKQSPAEESVAEAPPTDLELLAEIRDLLAAQQRGAVVPNVSNQAPAGPPWPNE